MLGTGYQSCPVDAFFLRDIKTTKTHWPIPTPDFPKKYPSCAFTLPGFDKIGMGNDGNVPPLDIYKLGLFLTIS